MNGTELSGRLARGPLLFDGGMGSLMISMGLEAGRAPEWWNLEHPERVEEAHRRYVEAGSDAISANTFGANPAKLAASGLAGRCEEVTARAVEIARRAAAGRALVAGELGPTGLMLAPLGTATEEQMAESFEAHARALAAAGVDLILVETMFDLREAVAAVRAAARTGLATAASMTFELRRKGFFTIMGNALVPSLEALAQAGAVAVGFNCSVTSDVMISMVEAAAGAVKVPIVAQPNAGRPRQTPEGVAYDAAPEPFARDVGRMVAAGARLVGGCCGTDPSFIRCAREALDARV